VEPILDETSLAPCQSWPTAVRVQGLAQTLKAFDGLGTPRVLRSVRDAVDRDIGDGRGLRWWCFHPGTDRDSGRLIAERLARQPFVDGAEGLFATTEGARAVEARLSGVFAFGAGLAALTGGVIVSVANAARPEGGTLSVDMIYLDDEGERSESLEVPAFASAAEVEQHRDALLDRLDRSVANGENLLARSDALFPRILFGRTAINQIATLTGKELVFPQLLRHLRVLDLSAATWANGEVFRPRGVTFSVESGPTLRHGTLGPMRDFPTPEGFGAERWSLHTKLTGGAGARLYFKPARRNEKGVVLIGYFGEHLPTVKYPT
jgi:hypothetical protein